VETPKSSPALECSCLPMEGFTSAGRVVAVLIIHDEVHRDDHDGDYRKNYEFLWHFVCSTSFLWTRSARVVFRLHRTGVVQSGAVWTYRAPRTWSIVALLTLDTPRAGQQRGYLALASHHLGVAVPGSCHLPRVRCHRATSALGWRLSRLTPVARTTSSCPNISRRRMCHSVPPTWDSSPAAVLEKPFLPEWVSPRLLPP
jgi:hypothetical protein